MEIIINEKTREKPNNEKEKPQTMPKKINKSNKTQKNKQKLTKNQKAKENLIINVKQNENLLIKKTKRAKRFLFYSYSKSG